MNIFKIKKQKSILYFVGLFLALLFLSSHTAFAALPKTFLFPNEFFKPKKALFTATYENPVDDFTQIPGTKCQYTESEGSELKYTAAESSAITIPKDGSYQAWADIYNHSDIDIGPQGETFTITLTFNPTGVAGGNKDIVKTVPALLIKQRVYFDLGYVLKGSRDFTLKFEGAPKSVLNGADKRIAICEFGISDSGKVSDVIGVKVFANPLHLSAEHWYKSGICRNRVATNIDNVCFSDNDCQGFICTGAPGATSCNNPDRTNPGCTIGNNSVCQSACVFNIANRGATTQVTVDGFTGVKSGRTTYVNATNLEGVNLYTNIYLLSYNENASEETQTIFKDLVKNWKFMENVSVVETRDQLKRDTTRFADIRSIQLLLRDYQRKKGYYPLWDNVRKTLSGGTYVPGVSISTWPSWKNTFAKELGSVLPTDPVNALKICPNPACGTDPAATLCNADPKTCWDEKSLKFACPTDAPNSHFYVYEILSASTYKLGTTFEYNDAGNWTPLLTGSLGEATALIAPVCALGIPNGDQDNDNVMDNTDNCPPSKCTTPLMCANPVSVCQSNQSLACSNPAADCPAAGDICVQPNADGDALGDICDVCPRSSGNDQDHDGVCENGADNASNQPDNCPTTFNPDQKDSDGNGSGDACDTLCQKDSDKDGVCDENDNCPFVFNPSQENYDEPQDPAVGQIWPNGRAFGDACDPNTDHDSDGFATGFCGAFSGAGFQVCNADSDCEGFALPAGVTSPFQAGLCRKLPASISAKMDNCNTNPKGETFNPGQEDYDKDLVGYVCDDCIDTDKDAFTNTIMNEGFESGLGAWSLVTDLKTPPPTSDNSRVGVHSNYAHLDDSAWENRTENDNAYRGVYSAWIQSITNATKRFVYKTFLPGPVQTTINIDTVNNRAQYTIKAQVKSDSSFPITMIVRRACHNNAGAMAEPVPYKANCKGGAGDIYATIASPANANWNTLEANFYIDYASAQDEVAIIFEIQNFGSFYIDDVQTYWRLSEIFGGADSCGAQKPDNCNNFNNSLQCVGGEKNGTACTLDANCLGADGASTADDGVCIQPDRDGDNIGDACDICTDSDADGFGDPGYVIKGCTGSYSASDNCPITPNTDQKDYDNDAKLCNFTIAMPYKTKSTFASCAGSATNFDPKNCDYCGGDVCDLDADGDKCYNWEQIKNNPANAQRNPPGFADVTVVSLQNREEDYLKTLGNSEDSWLKSSGDSDRDNLPDDCDAQVCGDAQVSAGAGVCSNPATGVQQCEECDRNNFGISSMCDEPNPLPGVNPGSTVRDMYPFNTANTNVKFIAHFDGNSVVALGRGKFINPVGGSVSNISYDIDGGNSLSVLGQSLVLTGVGGVAAKSTIQYPQSSYNSDEGTINLWVKPKNRAWPKLDIRSTTIPFPVVQTFNVGWAQNSWHMLSAKYVASGALVTYNLYVDGVKVSNDINMPPIVGDVDIPFWLYILGLQLDTPGSELELAIDEFVIFNNEILDDSIIKTMYEAVMNRCAESQGQQVTKYMADNYCAICNNSQCQIKALRMCNQVGVGNIKIPALSPTNYLWVGNQNAVNTVSQIAALPVDGNSIGDRVHEYRICIEGGNYCAWDLGIAAVKHSSCAADCTGGGAAAKDPTRIAVNIEDGTAWVAYRQFQTGVALFDNYKGFVKFCPLPACFIRGVAIDKNGNGWVGCTEQGGHLWKFNNKPGDCSSIDITGLAVYGLALDSQDNLWVSGNGNVDGTAQNGLVFRINSASAITANDAMNEGVCDGGKCSHYHTPNNYGLAVDEQDWAWVGENPSDRIYYIKPNLPSGNNAEFIDRSVATVGAVLGGTGGLRLGIGIEYTNIDQTLYNVYVLGSKYPEFTTNFFEIFGRDGAGNPEWKAESPDMGDQLMVATGDSEGNIWAIREDNVIRRMKLEIPINPATFTDYPTSAEAAGHYIYSDFTGINRAMVFRTGIATYPPAGGLSSYDTEFASWSRRWGKILYDRENTSDKNDIKVFVYLTDDPTTLSAVPNDAWILADPYDNTRDQYNKCMNQVCEKKGKYMKIRIVLSTKSKDSSYDPKILNLRITCRDNNGKNICQ